MVPFLRSPDPGDRFVFDRHALERLAERGITKEDVLAVAGQPTNVRASRDGPERWLLTRTLSGRRITVVLEPEAAHGAVVTAWIDS